MNLSARLIELHEAKKRGKKDYEIYHNSYSSAVAEAERYVEANGFEVDKEQMAQDIGLDSRRPKDGKTTKFEIALFKGDKEQRKRLRAQVYGRGRDAANLTSAFELNMYIS